MVRMSVSTKKNPTKVSICCRKADPFQGPKLGSCLTLGNELSEETHVLTKQEILLGKGTWVENSRVREPRRTALSSVRTPLLPSLSPFSQQTGKAIGQGHSSPVFPSVDVPVIDPRSPLTTPHLPAPPLHPVP